MTSVSATATDRGAERPAAVTRGPIPGRLGRYHLDRVIGAGGMGVVYRAFDPELSRAVAVKVLRPGEQADRARLRLLGEARAMAQLVHPNVVTVYEVGSEAGHDFIVMELVEGMTLTQWLRQASPRQGRIVEAFVAAGRGLAAAHATGMIHRDFKPDNVLCSIDGRFVVGDFGLARSSEAELPDGSRVARGSLPLVTVDAGLCGTPAYMAPEQWRGDALSSATDQWAFCVALWEALTGARPFRVTIETASEARWELPSDGGLPRRLRRVLARGLAADPAKRWPSLDALLAELSTGPTPAFHVAGAAAVFGIAYALTSGGEADAAFACEPRDQLAWSAAATSVLDDDVARATDLRERACASARPRAELVACLDGALARAAAIRHDDPGEVGGRSVDPSVCSFATPPRLHAFRPATSPTDEACRHAIEFSRSAGVDRAAAETSVALARLCGDDRLLADAHLAVLHHQVERARFRVVERSLERTADAVARVTQPDLLGVLAVERARYAGSRGALAEQLRHLDTAIELLGPRRPGLRAELMEQRIALGRQPAPDEPSRLQGELTTIHVHAIHGDDHHDHAARAEHGHAEHPVHVVTGPH